MDLGTLGLSGQDLLWMLQQVGNHYLDIGLVTWEGAGGTVSTFWNSTRHDAVVVRFLGLVCRGQSPAGLSMKRGWGALFQGPKWGVYPGRYHLCESLAFSGEGRHSDAGLVSGGVGICEW